MEATTNFFNLNSDWPVPPLSGSRSPESMRACTHAFEPSASDETELNASSEAGGYFQQDSFVSQDFHPLCLTQKLYGAAGFLEFVDRRFYNGRQYVIEFFIHSPRERNHVDSELSEIGIELSREAKAGGHAGHGDRN